MTKAIEIIKKPRITVLSFIPELTLEQLNYVPAGFNNNIVWNLGHMVAAQQGVCYKRAGLNTIVDDDFFNAYKPGSRPEKPIDAVELENILGLLLLTLDKLETDIADGIFANYVPWTTRYGVEINNITDAVNFLPFHDGLHVGTILAMKRFV